MAHHGFENFPNEDSMKEFLKGFKNPSISDIMENAAVTEGLGATGKYTDEKLNDSDEGEIMFGVAEYEGRIILNFGKPIRWFGLTKQQAKEFGELLIKKANQSA